MSGECLVTEPVPHTLHSLHPSRIKYTSLISSLAGYLAAQPVLELGHWIAEWLGIYLSWQDAAWQAICQVMGWNPSLSHCNFFLSLFFTFVAHLSLSVLINLFEHVLHMQVHVEFQTFVYPTCLCISTIVGTFSSLPWFPSHGSLPPCLASVFYNYNSISAFCPLLFVF